MVNADQLLARRLLAALASGGVEPFFQPIVSLDDGHVLGFEVLARWHDPSRASSARTNSSRSLIVLVCSIVCWTN